MKWLAIGVSCTIVGVIIVAFKSTIVFAVLFGFLLSVYFVSHPKVLILFLAIYLPFQDFVLRWVSPSLFLPIRWSSETLIAFCFIWLCLNKLVRREPLKRTIIDLPLLGFLLAVLLSALWNGSGFLDSAMWLGPVLRYVLLFYIIVNLDVDEKYTKKVIYIISICLAIQVSIGLIQYLGGETVSNFLAPQTTYTWKVGNIQRAIYQSHILAPLRSKFLFSTFDNGNQYGGFLVVNILVLVGLSRAVPIKKVLRLMILGLGVFVIVFTYSRQSWLAFYFGLLAIALVGKKKWLLFSLLSFFIFVSIVIGVFKFTGSPYEAREEVTLSGRFFSIFSEPFFGSTRKFGRGYILFDGSKQIAQKAPLLGIGPGANLDDFYTEFKFSYLAARHLGDVGWIDLFGRLGFLGSLAFLWILVRLIFLALRTYRYAFNDSARGISLGYIGALIAMMVLFFASAQFLIRTTSYYFWLWSAILLVYVESQKKNDQRIRNDFIRKQ